MVGAEAASRARPERPAERRGSRRALGVLAVATDASLAYSLWVTATDPSWAYFVTPARAWQFGAGALLAFAPAPRRLGLTARARGLLGWAGLVVLLSSSLVFDESTPFPGTAALGWSRLGGR